MISINCCSFRNKIVAVLFLTLLPVVSHAQSMEIWYANAQERIDTLRKGTFGLKIVDKNGQPFSGQYSVRMVKHGFPFGIAFDLYDTGVNYGNTYITAASIQAESDAEIYKTERYYTFLAYAIPVEKDRDYRLTLKFAEIYWSTQGSRIFDVYVEGQKFLSDYDIFIEAGGKNIAVDTSVYITSSDTLISIEFTTSVDNAAIKGIEIQTVEGDWITRINCGGDTLTTVDGHYYHSDQDFFDQNASRYPTEEQWMKSAMQKYFNYGTSGNSFKWSGIQPQHTAPDYQAFDNAVNWTQSIGWELRAHTLLWGGDNYEDDHALPRWIKDLPTAQAITDTCKMRVIREVTRYKGIVKEYDVMNEPLHATYLSGRVGDSINWNCFKWAGSADPGANLFINEYNVEHNWGDADEYLDLILQIKSMGGPVTGVGIQAHFWEGQRPDVTEFVTQINKIAEAGLPIKLTEFDNGPLSEKDQAADVVKVMKIAFSHPAINGMVFWALSDRGAWRPESGLFDANHKPKLAADSLLHYTHKLWATNFDSAATGDVATIFEAYYGNYNVEVHFGDTVKVFSIPCIKENEDSVFILHEENAILKGPELLEARLLSDTSLVIVFNKSIQNESISTGDFKFFSDNLLRIQDIKVDPVNDSSVVIKLQNIITPDDFLCVSYSPGSLASADGAKAIAFGPEPVENLVTGLVSAMVTNDGINVEATFNANLLNLSENISSFMITVNSQPVIITDLNYKENDSSIIVFTLASPVIKGDKVTIKYTRGTLAPVYGFICSSSPEIAVFNLWPSLVKAEVNSKGTQVSALFNTRLQNVLQNKDAFSIKSGDQPVEISTISETGTDSSKVAFIFTDPISKGQIVSLSYQPGTIKGINGNSLTAIDNAHVVNRSTITGIIEFVANGLPVYPNPASNIIKITSQGINSVSVFNSLGVLVYKRQCNSEMLTIDVSSFQRGIYMIQVVNGNGETSTGKIILQ
jgi:uncharacterized repeat protein (TIGR02059 family)